MQHGRSNYRQCWISCKRYSWGHKICLVCLQKLHINFVGSHIYTGAQCNTINFWNILSIPFMTGGKTIITDIVYFCSFTAAAFPLFKFVLFRREERAIELSHSCIINFWSLLSMIPGQNFCSYIWGFETREVKTLFYAQK